MPKKGILVENGKLALFRASMVATYCIKLFRMVTDSRNGILMSLLLLIAETASRCWLCLNKRWIKSLADKKAFVFKGNLCFKCFSKTHVLKNYKSDFLCRIDGCSKKHHILLHGKSRVSINASLNILYGKVTCFTHLCIKCYSFNQSSSR